MTIKDLSDSFSYSKELPENFSYKFKEILGNEQKNEEVKFDEELTPMEEYFNQRNQIKQESENFYKTKEKLPTLNQAYVIEDIPNPNDLEIVSNISDNAEIFSTQTIQMLDEKCDQILEHFGVHITIVSLKCLPEKCPPKTLTKALLNSWNPNSFEILFMILPESKIEVEFSAKLLPLISKSKNDQLQNLCDNMNSKFLEHNNYEDAVNDGLIAIENLLNDNCSKLSTIIEHSNSQINSIWANSDMIFKPLKNQILSSPSIEKRSADSSSTNNNNNILFFVVPFIIIFCWDDIKELAQRSLGNETIAAKNNKN